jgi:hypothetical protein
VIAPPLPVVVFPVGDAFKEESKPSLPEKEPSKDSEKILPVLISLWALRLIAPPLPPVAFPVGDVFVEEEEVEVEVD